MFPACLPNPLAHKLATAPAAGKRKTKKRLRRPTVPHHYHHDPPVTNYAGQEVFVSGWGCKEEEKCEVEADRPKKLRETRIPVIHNDLAMCW